MITRIFFIACLQLPILLFAQTSAFTVTGQVVNGESKEPLQGASVFADNTTIGTATDASGRFTLQLPNGGYEIAVTFTGFYTATKRVNPSDASGLVFDMSPREKELATVSVVATTEVTDGLAKYGSFFIEQFIGKTANAKLTTIKNPEVLKFYFSKKRNRLKVLAAEPLVIENSGLGYNIKYSLDSFTHEYASQVSLYTGNPLFEEMATTSTTQQAAWLAAREEAYRGSIIHFMRSAYSKRLREEGFDVQFMVNVNGYDSALKLKNIYAALHYQKDDSLSFAEMQPNQSKVVVIYTKEKPAEAFLAENEKEPMKFQFSILNFTPGRSITLEQNGYYYEQNDITTDEYWTWERVADQVPYDFISN